MIKPKNPIIKSKINTPQKDWYVFLSSGTGSNPWKVPVVPVVRVPHAHGVVCSIHHTYHTWDGKKLIFFVPFRPSFALFLDSPSPVHDDFNIYERSWPGGLKLFFSHTVQPWSRVWTNPGHESEQMWITLKVVLRPCSVSSFEYRWSIEGWIHFYRRRNFSWVCQTTRTGSRTVCLNPKMTLTKFWCHLVWHRRDPFLFVHLHIICIFYFHIYFYFLSSEPVWTDITRSSLKHVFFFLQTLLCVLVKQKIPTTHLRHVHRTCGCTVNLPHKRTCHCSTSMMSFSVIERWILWLLFQQYLCVMGFSMTWG
jgi:hypothetical protein